MQARQLPTKSISGARCGVRRCTPVRALGVPDYTQPPVPGQRRKLQRDPLQGSGSAEIAGSRATPDRKWWDYKSPTAATGRPDIQLKPVTIPQVSPGGGGTGGGGNGGGSGGDGGSGNGGSGNGGSSNGGSNGGGGRMRGPTYLFALFLFAGGLMAYIRKGSTKSLLFASAAATLLLISASMMHHRSGTLLALGTCLGLAAAMGQRANKSRKVFPAGVVAILSALMTIAYGRSLA